MEIRALTLAERLYTDSLNAELKEKTGWCGMLVERFHADGPAYSSTWNDILTQDKSQGFKTVFENFRRTMHKDGGLLHDKPSMTLFLKNIPAASFGRNKRYTYGFRTDVGEYAVLTRCAVEKDKAEVCCTFYVRELLDRHMEHAEQGISFIDTTDKELFRLPDGGEIIVHGQRFPCRFLDETHLEIDHETFSLRDFAQYMEERGVPYEPRTAAPYVSPITCNEIIERVSVEKNGVYLTSRNFAEDQSRPWKSTALSAAYTAEGRVGLDREVMRMLCEGAELLGRDASIERYRYAKESTSKKKLCSRCNHAIRARFWQMNEYERQSIGCHPTPAAQEYLAFQHNAREKLYADLAMLCAEYERLHNFRSVGW